MQEADQGKPLHSSQVRHHGCQIPFSSGQYLAWITISLQSLAFFAMIAPIYENSTIPLLYICILCLILVSGAHCTCCKSTDSHILSRHVEIEKITPKIKDRIFRIVPDGAEKQLKWCELCEWVIDARSAHCTSCKRCTIRVSHHCWFINNCVGEKNYASFIGLLISSAALLVIQLICVVQTAIFVHGDYSGFLKRSHWFANYYSSRLVVNSVLGLLVILGIGSLGFVLQFLVFQAFLKMKGMTMIEYAAKNKRLNLI